MVKKNLFAVIALIIAFASVNALQSQVKGLSNTSLDKEDFFKLQTKVDAGSSSMLEQDKMPVGNDVDPKYYYLGPGDIISLQVLPMIPIETPVVVSPDMTILLPRGGEISVRNMTLAQLKDSLTRIFKERSAESTVHITLKRGRLCIVTINGNVLFPGTYSLPSSYRVSTAIKFANQVPTDKALSDEDKLSIQKLQGAVRERSKNFSEAGVSVQNFYSNRNITLLRRQIGSQNVDIEKANATGDYSFDPFVKEGDEIFVPFEPYNYPRVTVSGAIRRPAVVSYKRGDKLSEMVKFGYGLTEDADINSIKLFQNNLNPIKVSIDKDLNLLGEDIEIQPGATLVFGRLPEIEYENLSVVSIRGQVQSPGIYPVDFGKTRLKDVVQAAGGFTSKAYLPLAYIIRRQEKVDAYLDYRRDYYTAFQYSDLTIEDTSRFSIDMMLKKPIVSCDFTKAFFENSEIDNVLLRDGDVIMVPDNPGYVYVYGQVNHPGYVEFREGQTMEWYVEKAGGYAKGATKNRARIIRGKSRVWTEGNESTFVLAGDEIYVPRPPDIPQGLEWQKYGTIASLVSVTFAVIGTIFNIYLLSKDK